MNGHLVLTRREGESIVMETNSGPIDVRVVRTGPGRVRLSIAAPKNVRIRRSELAPGCEEDAR